jgi:hypothetical protein
MAATGAQFELMMIVAVGKAGMCEVAARGSIGFVGGTACMFHRFSRNAKK